jgi:hypothetical protein
MREWIEWGDETLVYACNDTYDSGMYLFWADIWLDDDDGFHAILFGVDDGYTRTFADADDIVVDSLESAEEYLLEEGMTNADVVFELDGVDTDLGMYSDYESAKEAIDAWIRDNG